MVYTPIYMVKKGGWFLKLLEIHNILRFCWVYMGVPYLFFLVFDVPLDGNPILYNAFMGARKRLISKRRHGGDLQGAIP